MKRTTVPLTVAIALIAMFVLMVWPFDLFAGGEARAIKQVGRLMDKIHRIDDACQLKKTTEADAAAAMFVEVEKIRKLAANISDTAAIKQPLEQFLSTWTSAALIQASIADGRQVFMADVTGFYLRGLVEHREGSRTLFPMFRP